jgi:hypothetical protein
MLPLFQSTIGDALYGERTYTPAIAWACWLHVARGLFWYHDGAHCIIRSPEAVAQRRLEEAAAAAAAAAGDQPELANDEPADAGGSVGDDGTPGGAKRVRLRATKESRLRLHKVALARVSRVYAALSDREITALLARATFLQVHALTQTTCFIDDFNKLARW